MNEVIGGWKRPQEMTGVSFPYDVENQRRGEPGRPNRTEGDLEAIRRAYLSGHVFMGHVDVPILDTRHYLDPVLDMHHFLQSFAARARIEAARGSTENHVIWVAHRESPIPLYWMAVQVMDQWLENLEKYPERGVGGNRPAAAVDSCWDETGELIASGDGVWDEGGACREIFPPYENSRTLAGMPIAGNVFKCQLMPVEEAVARGYYPTEGPNAFGPEDIERLRTIFPDGVCDYTLPDAGLPPELVRWKPWSSWLQVRAPPAPGVFSFQPVSAVHFPGKPNRSQAISKVPRDSEAASIGLPQSSQSGASPQMGREGDPGAELDGWDRSICLARRDRLCLGNFSPDWPCCSSWLPLFPDSLPPSW